MRTSTYIFLFAAILIPTAILAGDEVENGEFAENKKRWESMDDDEKQVVIGAYRQWKGFADERRKALRMKYDKFKSLPRDEKLALTVNSKRWLNLNQTQRCNVRNFRSRVHRAGAQMHVRAAFRIIGLLMEDGKPFSKPDVMDRFRQAHEEYILKRLSDKQKRIYHSLKTKRERARYIAKIVTSFFEDEIIGKYPGQFSDMDPDSAEYRRKLSRYALRRLSEKVIASLPPSQFEMALFIRNNVQSRLLKTVASCPPEKRRRQFNRIADNNNIKKIVDKMPVKMQERFKSFSPENKLKTLKMGLKPFTRLRAFQLEILDNHNCTSPPRRRIN